MRTWADAIAALDEKDAWETIAFDEAVRLHPEHWDGWPYCHEYRRAARYLESLESLEKTDDEPRS